MQGSTLALARLPGASKILPGARQVKFNVGQVKFQSVQIYLNGQVKIWSSTEEMSRNVIKIDQIIHWASFFSSAMPFRKLYKPRIC